MCHQQKWLFYLSNGLHSTCTKIDEQFKCKCDRVHSIFFSPFRSSFEKESKGESPIGCYTAKISSEFQIKLFDHFFFGRFCCVRASHALPVYRAWGWCRFDLSFCTVRVYITWNGQGRVSWWVRRHSEPDGLNLFSRKLGHSSAPFVVMRMSKRNRIECQWI